MIKGANSWTMQYPELDTSPIDVDYFLSANAYEYERSFHYKEAWLNVGHMQQLSRPGDFFCAQMDFASASIVIVLGRDRQLRAFHNVCSHRGARIVRQESGHATKLVCPFHAWTYGLDGRLQHVTDGSQFFDLDKATLGLTPVAVDHWNGLIFVCLNPQPKLSLVEFLAPLQPRIGAYPPQAMVCRAHYRASLKANWKLAMSAFQEGYHVPFLHRNSAGRAYAGSGTPYIHALDFSLLGLHQAASFPRLTEFQPTKLEMVAFRYGASVTGGDQTPHAEATQALNPTKSDNWSFDMFVIFPNFMIFAFESFYFTYNFWPVSVGETDFELKIYFPPPTNAGQAFSQELAICGLRDTLMEDGPVIEAMQQGLASGAKPSMHLQDQEILIRASRRNMAVFPDWLAAQGAM